MYTAISYHLNVLCCSQVSERRSHDGSTRKYAQHPRVCTHTINKYMRAVKLIIPSSPTFLSSVFKNLLYVCNFCKYSITRRKYRGPDEHFQQGMFNYALEGDIVRVGRSFGEERYQSCASSILYPTKLLNALLVAAHCRCFLPEKITTHNIVVNL